MQQGIRLLLRRSLCPDFVRAPDPLQVGEKRLFLQQPLVEIGPGLEQRLVRDLDHTFVFTGVAVAAPDRQ